MDALAEEIRVDRFGGVEGTDTRPDLGTRAVGGAGQELPIDGQQVNGHAGSGVAIYISDGAGEDPRVAAQE